MIFIERTGNKKWTDPVCIKEAGQVLGDRFYQGRRLGGGNKCGLSGEKHQNQDPRLTRRRVFIDTIFLLAASCELYVSQECPDQITLLHVSHRLYLVFIRPELVILPIQYHFISNNCTSALSIVSTCNIEVYKK